MNGLPPRVKGVLRAQAEASHTEHMQEVKANISSSNNIVRHSAARSIDEPSPQQARAIDKILRLP